MKKYLLILLTYFLGQNILGQETELFQPDTVYKKCKVKKRIVSFDSKSTKAALVFSYDRAGKLSEYCLTDNETGKKNQFRIVYNYDQMGKPISEALLTDNIDETENTKYIYDSSGQLLKKETFNLGGQLIKLETIAYNPLTKTEIFYRFNSDTIYRSQTAVYENQFAYTRFYGFEYREGKKEIWDYKYKNYFDNENRLVKREDSLWNPLKILEYYYDKKGLLIKKTERFDKPKSQTFQTQFIRYEFWE